MIYVDDAQIPATVHGRFAAWSHLVAIPFNESELLEFGKRLGCRAGWLQLSSGGRGNCTHFDVSNAKREQALALGATPVTSRELSELIRKEKERRRL